MSRKVDVAHERHVMIDTLPALVELSELRVVVTATIAVAAPAVGVVVAAAVPVVVVTIGSELAPQ